MNGEPVFSSVHLLPRAGEKSLLISSNLLIKLPPPSPTPAPLSPIPPTSTVTGETAPQWKMNARRLGKLMRCVKVSISTTDSSRAVQCSAVHSDGTVTAELQLLLCISSQCSQQYFLAYYIRLRTRNRLHTLQYTQYTVYSGSQFFFLKHCRISIYNDISRLYRIGSKYF